MNNTPFTFKPDLADAQGAMAKLLPVLPWPSRSERLDPCGLTPDPAPLSSPILEQPQTLIRNIGPFVGRNLPESWQPAFQAHKQRLHRNAQFLRLRHECPYISDTDLTMLDEVDGVVAGALLFSLRPMPSPLRSALLKRCCSDWWGAWLTARAMVFADEVTPLLSCIANEPRLSASLWRENADLAGPLAQVAIMHNDLWSATIALTRPLAEQWLNRVCVSAEQYSLAAVTALVLQPGASVTQKSKWIAQLKHGHPRLAYLAIRWTRVTWPTDWEMLCNELRDNACSDQALSWYHFFRDCADPSSIDAALRESNVEVLWQAELIAHVRNSGQELRRRMAEQLRANPGDKEAVLALKWLSRRKRPHD